MLDSLLRSEFVAKVAESDWVKKNITGKAITLQLQVLHIVLGILTEWDGSVWFTSLLR